MNIDWLQILLVIYVIGLITAFIFVAEKFIAFRRLKQHKVVDLLALRPELRPYLIRKVLFWPYYLLVEKNPVMIISELFFSRYGNKHHVYCGERGIKNFINDLIKGKNRYQNYCVKVHWVKLEEQSKAYQNYAQYHKDKQQVVCARIICAKHLKHNDHYLLMIHRMPEDMVDSSEDEQSVTRFDLDECCRVSLIELQTSLSEISPEIAQETIKSFPK